MKGPIEIQDEILCVDDILLDPLNPRFGFEEVGIESHQFNDRQLQLELIDKMKNYGMKDLIDSISENGFILLERVIVVRLEEESNQYVVVEGNRRLAAIKLIIKDELKDIELRESLQQIKVGILSKKVYCTSEDERYRVSSLAHLSGKFEWGDYQKAIFLSNCIERYGKTSEEAGKEIGLGRNNAKAMYQAYKVYQSIQKSSWYEENENEGYRDEDYFPFFYEAMKKSEIKEQYFKVNKKNIVCKPENLKRFCEWIGITIHEEIKKRQIRDKYQVKDLVNVLSDKVSREAIEAGQSIEEAMRVIQIENANHKRIILSFWNYLQKVSKKGIQDYLEQLSNQDITRLTKIKGKLEEILEKNSGIKKD